MATATQVPWSDPGGAPCCCETQCPVHDSGFSTATKHTISSSDYASLYAGGTMRVETSGTAAGTSQSSFGSPPAWTCSTSGSFSGVFDFLCSSNLCDSQSTRTQISSVNAYSPNYAHFLESEGGIYKVIFYVGAGGGSSTNCGTGQLTSIQSGNTVYNDGGVPTAGSYNTGVGFGLRTVTASSIAITLPNSSLSVPSYVVGDSTNIFFQNYTSVSVTNTTTCVWTPLAP